MKIKEYSVYVIKGFEHHMLNILQLIVLISAIILILQSLTTDIVSAGVSEDMVPLWLICLGYILIKSKWTLKEYIIPNIGKEYQNRGDALATLVTIIPLLILCTFPSIITQIIVIIPAVVIGVIILNFNLSSDFNQISKSIDKLMMTDIYNCEYQLKSKSNRTKQRVLNFFLSHPETSIKEASIQLNLSKSTISKYVKKLIDEENFLNIKKENGGRIKGIAISAPNDF